MSRGKPITPADYAKNQNQAPGHEVWGPTEGTLICLHVPGGRMEFHFHEGLSIEEADRLNRQFKSCKSFDSIVAAARSMAAETNQNTDLKIVEV